MQGQYESYTERVVSAYRNGVIPVEVALKKILDLVISSVEAGQFEMCLSACSDIAESDLASFRAVKEHAAPEKDAAYLTTV